jgi:hypothetical protein
MERDERKEGRKEFNLIPSMLILLLFALLFVVEYIPCRKG